MVLGPTCEDVARCRVLCATGVLDYWVRLATCEGGPGHLGAGIWLWLAVCWAALFARRSWEQWKGGAARKVGNAAR